MALILVAAAVFALILIIIGISKIANLYLRGRYEQVQNSERGNDAPTEVMTTVPVHTAQTWQMQSHQSHTKREEPVAGCVDAVERAFYELERLRLDRVCKICMSAPACMLFDPCGHLSTCSRCSSALNQCPMCRRGIRRKIRAYT